MKTSMHYIAFLLSLCLTVYVNANEDAENLENQPGMERRFFGMPSNVIKISKAVGTTPFSPFMNPMNPMMGYGLNPYTSAYGGYPMQHSYGMGLGGGLGMGLGGMGMGLGGMGMGLGGHGMGLGGMGMGMPFGTPSPLIGHSTAFGFGGMGSPYGAYGMGPKIVHKVTVPGMGMGVGMGMGMGFPGMTPQFLSNLPKDEEPK